MSVRSDVAKSAAPMRLRLPERKGNELLGVVLITLALLWLGSLTTFHPDDPSVLHQTTDERSTRNLVGPFGAEVAALSFELGGVVSFFVPVFLLLIAWRRLRPPRAQEPTLGRGLGCALILGVLPPLAQLALGELSWRGELLQAGGVLGDFVAREMSGRLNVVGSFVVLLGVMTVGLALVVPSSLGEVLNGGTSRLRSSLSRIYLVLARLRERRAKDRARRRVVAKHVGRAKKERSFQAPELLSVGVAPLRVVERTGEAPLALRRRTPQPPGVVEDAQVEPPSVPRSLRKKAEPRRPQSELPFEPAAQGQSLPPLNLLNLSEERNAVHEDDLVRLGEVICQRCREFGVEGSIEGICPGPVITVFELQPAPGVKVSQIVNLQDDLALALKAEAIRIDRLPGRSTLGIEVPNAKRNVIHLGPLLAKEPFRASSAVLTMAIGKTLHGEPFYFDLATMPHLLVAGATGAGKSVGLQSMITSMLYKATREQVQFIFIDPKRIELGVYADIPHLKAEVVVEPKKAANALRWAVAEMENRYRLLAELHVRSIDFYNRAVGDPEVQKRLALREEEVGESQVEDLSPLPYYVVVIDELADLMMVSSSDVETSIARLAQMARAVGIHLIVATQRPSVDVLTGTIKANFPCRVAYATATRHDSRTILDQVGAEKLLGQGDMLFMPPGSSRTVRLHGAYVSEQETAALVRWLKKRGRPELDPAVVEAPPEGRAGGETESADDVLFDQAARLVVAERQASASFLQRRLRVGFSRAARLIDMMEQDGLLGPSQGSKPREVLVGPDYFTELDSS